MSTHYTFEGKCYIKTTLVGCETGKQAYNALLKEHCTQCKATYFSDVNKQCYLKIVGCETNVATKGVVSCDKCLITHHTVSKTCREKVIPEGCIGHANTVWLNGVDYCDKCKSTHYTYQGKCYVKNTLEGCAANS